MTQENRNTFLTSVPVPMLNTMVDDDKVSRDLKPSEELFEMNTGRKAFFTRPF